MSEIDKEIIDDLVSNLSNIKLIETELDSFLKSKNSNMPSNKIIDYQLLRLYLDTIPSFEGNPSTLNIFIDSCTQVLSTFGNTEKLDDPINPFLTRAILGKLTGRALMLIGNRNDIGDWQALQNILRLSFSDQRNLDCLVQDLILMQPHKNESAYNFCLRCQDARCLIHAKVNSDTSLDSSSKVLQIKNFD